MPFLPSNQQRQSTEGFNDSKLQINVIFAVLFVFCIMKQSVDLHYMEISRLKNREKELLHKVFAHFLKEGMWAVKVFTNEILQFLTGGAG